MSSAALWTASILADALPTGVAGLVGVVVPFLPKSVTPWHMPEFPGVASSNSPVCQIFQCCRAETHPSQCNGGWAVLSNHFWFSGCNTSPWASGMTTVPIRQIEACPSGWGPSAVQATMLASLSSGHTTEPTCRYLQRATLVLRINWNHHCCLHRAPLPLTETLPPVNQAKAGIPNP